MVRQRNLSTLMLLDVQSNPLNVYYVRIPCSILSIRVFTRAPVRSILTHMPVRIE